MRSYSTLLGSFLQKTYLLFAIILMAIISLYNPASAQSGSCDLNNFVTYTQGGWGNKGGKLCDGVTKITVKQLPTGQEVSKGNGTDKLGSNTTFTYSNGKSVVIHTSCSQPIYVGMEVNKDGFTYKITELKTIPSSSTNPGNIRDLHFPSVFPSGLVVGQSSGFTLKLSEAKDVKDFLPAGGTPKALDKNYVDSKSTKAGVFAGQAVALKMNIAFSDAGKIGTGSVKLGSLIVCAGPLAGKTVYEVMDIVNKSLSGGTTPYSYSQLNDAATAINENFDEGKVNKGFLKCPTTPVLGSISGSVFFDVNSNGSFDSFEFGLKHVTVKLYEGSVQKAVTLTDEFGFYKFSNLPAGGYKIQAIDPPLLVLTTTHNPINLTLGSGENKTNNNFGYKCGPSLAKISGYAYVDANKNGIKELGEAPLKDVVIKLYDEHGQIETSMLTDDAGFYEFRDLIPGIYTVEEIDPDMYRSVTSNWINLMISAGESSQNNNFGDILSADICGIVFDDLNSNGVKDPSELGIKDVLVELFIKATGEFVASTTTGVNGEYCFGYLIPNVYKVKETDPAGYVSTSPNEITVTANQGDKKYNNNFGDKLATPHKGSISGLIWNDLNKNGVQDHGEPGMKDVTVKLYDCHDNWIAEKKSASDGKYNFGDLSSGSYTILAQLPSGFSFSPKDNGHDDSKDSDVDPITWKTDCINLAAGQNKADVDAGMYLSATCSIGDRVWNDKNKNGIQDAGEPGMANVKVKLITCSSSVYIDTKLTDHDGKYLFTGVTAGNYTLIFEDLPAGWKFSPKDAGHNDLLDSDVDPSTGKIYCINIDPSWCDSNSTKWDAGIYQDAPPPTCSIGDRVWEDKNKNGVQDSGEPGVKDITVKLTACSSSTAIKTTKTNEHGNYLFADVIAGQYQIQFELPTGYEFSPANKTNDLFDSDVEYSNGKTTCFTIDPSWCDSNSTKWDAGIYLHTPPPTCAIGDRVWEDKNKNGVQDAGEPGVKDITVKLFACSTSSPLFTTKTDHDGKYLFPSVVEGFYTVKFEGLPAGYSFTSKDAGHNDLIDSDVDPATGKTACFNIDPSWCDSNSTKWDAGIISCPPGVKVAGKVFNDANGNGVHDAGEVGIANVEMKLWGIAANLIATTLTDALGKFEFMNVIDGQYHVQEIDLPGYVSTTPNSEFITIAGADKYGLKFGDKVKPTPEPCDLTKYSTMTQNSWKSVKGYNLLDSKFTTLFTSGLIIGDHGAGYQIKFTSANAVKNFMPQSGVPYALDQSYINPVNTPAGEFAGHILALALNLAYNDAGLLGHTSTTKLGNLVVGSGPLKDFKVYEVLNIVNKALGGTVSPFDMATLNHVVKKINENFDNCNLGFLVCPPPPDPCGGGFDAGVESNSNLADLLLRRLTKIEYGQTTKMLRNPKIAFTASYGLNELFPNVGPLGSTPKETTPFDILGISNATSAYAVDYNLNMAKGDVRVASIFATTTNPPYVYEHTKSICDRLIDAELQHLSHVEINGNYYFASVLYKQAENLYDYTINFSVYEKGGTFIVDSRWLIEDYDVPSGVSNVYNFQVWASNFNSTMYLVMSIIDQFASRGMVQYNNSISLPPTLVYVQKGKYSHTGTIELVVQNNQVVADNITIKTKSRSIQGSGKIESSQSFGVQPGLNTIYLKTGVISDANLYISSSNGFRDEVFVSGGAYTYLNGSASKVDEFVTNTFTTVSASELPSEALILSGGAKVKGKLSDWVSMFRSLTANTAPYDLSDYNALKVTMRGYGKVWLRLEQDGISEFNYHAKQIVLDGSALDLTIPFSELKQVGSSTAKFDPSLVRKISIYMDKADNSTLTNFEFEIKNIAFLSKNGSDRSKGESVPTEFKLSQNYPNPFNPSTLIEFSVAKSEFVTIKVYNVLGKEVANLVNETKKPGVHSVRFDANGLSSGVYLYKIQSESYTATKKMILQK